jgi:mannose-6-phosphate isomerase-like protein (cupin superfamily)
VFVQVRLLGFLFAATAVLSVSAADPPGVEHWTAAQLKEYERTLAAKMSAQKVASQQLADFGNHTALVAHREGNGQAEVHMTQADVFVIQTGEATVQVGGELVGGKEVRPNEMLGASIKGGVEKKVRAGDVLHIPAKTPHQMMVQAGQQVTYLVIKVTSD